MTNSIRSLLQFSLFARTDDAHRFTQIISWWEKRRVWFNLIIGVTGILSCVIMFGLVSLMTQIYPKKDWFGDQWWPLFGIPLYGIMANVCYTLGWIAEIIAVKYWQERSRYFGQISFSLGLFFSILLTLVPAMICFVLTIVFIILPPR
jgi:hypothetical protein